MGSFVPLPVPPWKTLLKGGLKLLCFRHLKVGTAWRQHSVVFLFFSFFSFLGNICFLVSNRTKILHVLSAVACLGLKLGRVKMLVDAYKAEQQSNITAAGWKHNCIILLFVLNTSPSEERQQLEHQVNTASGHVKNRRKTTFSTVYKRHVGEQ